MSEEINAPVIRPDPISSIPATVKQVITNPVEFYRAMPKGGGFADPIVFMAVLGAVGGILRALLSIVGLGGGLPRMASLGSIIMMPVVVLIGGFIAAALLFVIWKLLGSQKSYETAYRCWAYSAAIVPITVLLAPIPYAGSVIGLAWLLYLVVIASTEVHRIPAQKAWLVFGIIFVILALIVINGQIKIRRMVAIQKTWGTPATNGMTFEQVRAIEAIRREAQKQSQKSGKNRKQDSSDKE